MKNILLFCFNIVFGGLAILSFASCKANPQEVAEQNNVLVADTMENEFAEAFQIVHHRTFIEINIIDPDSKHVLNTYNVAKTKETPDGMFPREIQSVVTLSVTQIGMLRTLNLEDVIYGVSSYKHLCNPMSKAKVAEVGDVGQADSEAFVTIDPDVILYSGFNDNAPIFNKLDQANLKTFKILEWKENHPMGRAEWIKVYGALFQKETEAKALFEEIKGKYYNLVDKLKTVEEGPTLFAGTYFGDVFNVPAGDSYMAQLFKDANIDYKYAKTEGTASLSLSLEEVITENANTEYWLNASAASRDELMKQSQKFEMLEATRNGKLYTYFNNTNCFWENSPIEPYKVLEDLGKIFHPHQFEEHELNYYERIK